MSRDPKELVPVMQTLYAKFCEVMDKAGLRFILTCTRRTQEEQDELYKIGRSKPGSIVTWTHKSRHIDGKAFDIAMMDDHGKVTWDPNAYNKAGEIGEIIGLEWGGSWRKPDRPHFQLKEEA